MDDYEYQQVLEAMAGAAASASTDRDGIEEAIDDTVQRWQRLFDFSYDEAMDRIVQHRNDLVRATLSDDHWKIVQQEKEIAGYNREAYEYELNLERRKAILANAVPTREPTNDITFLVELKGPLATVEAVRQAAQLDSDPGIVSGQSAETWDPVQLCSIDAKAKANLLRWASTEGRGYEPTILVNPKSLQS